MKSNQLLLLLLFFNVSFSQSNSKSQKAFTQKDLNAYEIQENKYDLWPERFSFVTKDSAFYFVDPSKYKGNINYGVDFSAKDKRVFNYIENYTVFQTEVIFEKFIFSQNDSIAEIEGRIFCDRSAFNSTGKQPKDVYEVFVGEVKKIPFIYSFYPENFNTRDYTITHQGEEKTTRFPLDTLDAMIFQKLKFRTTVPGSQNFTIRFKVDKNSVLAIGREYCYAHFYEIGAMIYSKQRKKAKPVIKKAKNALNFTKIIENNIQVNDPKNQIKKAIPPYYQLTEKAETYIRTRQFAKAKETYFLLAKEHQTIFARDIHNAIRCGILSRDLKIAFWWSEKLAAKGIELPYFKAKIFNGMRKNQQWKAFQLKFDSISKVSKANWNLNLKQELTNLLNEDQADYGLENRKEPVVLYETTKRVTGKFIELLKREGYPSEEKIGVPMKNDTTLIISPDFNVIIRHAVQQKSENLKVLNELLDKSQQTLEYDGDRSVNNRMFPSSCFHIYKGNLYNSKSCSNNDGMVKKMTFMFNNPNNFILDNGDFIISEYNEKSPEEYDNYYQSNFNLIMKLTDDWKFYEK